MDQLSGPEKDLIQGELLRDVRVKRIDFTGELDEQLFDSVFLEVMTEWGVICNHPSSALEQSHSAAKKCGVCGCLVFPANTGTLAKGKVV